MLKRTIAKIKRNMPKKKPANPQFQINHIAKMITADIIKPAPINA